MTLIICICVRLLPFLFTCKQLEHMGNIKRIREVILNKTYEQSCRLDTS